LWWLLRLLGALLLLKLWLLAKPCRLRLLVVRLLWLTITGRLLLLEAGQLLCLVVTRKAGSLRLLLRSAILLLLLTKPRKASSLRLQLLSTIACRLWCERGRITRLI